MLSYHLRVDMHWIHLQAAGEMETESQGVQKRSSAQHVFMTGEAVWAVIGAVAIVLGVVLVRGGRRRPES